MDNKERKKLNESMLWALSEEGRKMFMFLVYTHELDPDLAFEVVEIELGEGAYGDLTGDEDEHGTA